MAIEAPLSKHSKTNCRLGIVLLLGTAVVFAYDGYLSQYEWSLRRSFYEDHSKSLLFHVETEMSTGPDAGAIPQELRRAFGEANKPLSASATISPEGTGGQWVIADGARKYSLRKETAGLAVYVLEPDETMIINRVSPFFLGAGGIALAVWFWSRKDMKLVADQNELIVSAKTRIPYDAIEKIDKTHFESKGFFTITYKTGAGREVDRKLNDRTYDNLRPILDHLIAKIT